MCVSLGVYVCQHEYFRGPTLSGGDRASPERGHAALQGGGLEGLDRERERERETKRKKERNREESKISSSVWTRRRFTNRKTRTKFHIIRKSLQVRKLILFSKVCSQGTTKLKRMFPQTQRVWLDKKIKRKYILSLLATWGQLPAFSTFAKAECYPQQNQTFVPVPRKHDNTTKWWWVKAPEAFVWFSRRIDMCYC